jgi:hypothetical protein
MNLMPLALVVSTKFPGTIPAADPGGGPPEGATVDVCATLARVLMAHATTAHTRAPARTLRIQPFLSFLPFVFQNSDANEFTSNPPDLNNTHFIGTL